MSAWEDKWIPWTHTLKPIGRLGTSRLEEDSDLIDKNNGSGKISAVRANFLSLDAEAILNIPLHANGGKMCWLGALRG
jgi:hypothetical protein